MHQTEVVMKVLDQDHRNYSEVGCSFHMSLHTVDASTRTTYSWWFFTDGNGCRSNFCFVFSFSPSLKLPAWWRSCPTYTWSWTMACVSAERKVSRSRRQCQEAKALLSLSSSTELLAPWVIFSRITVPSPTIAFTFRALSLFFPCCQLGHLLISSAKVTLTNHRVQVDYPTGWKAISRWDMFETKV